MATVITILGHWCKSYVGCFVLPCWYVTNHSCFSHRSFDIPMSQNMTSFLRLIIQYLDTELFSQNYASQVHMQKSYDNVAIGVQ